MNGGADYHRQRLALVSAEVRQSSDVDENAMPFVRGR